MRARLAIFAIATAFLGAGLYGAWLYVHNYVVYRGFPPPVDPPGVRHGRLRRVRFFSKPLGRRDSYLVYLPPGYANEVARGVRFPTLYLLHGTYTGGEQFINAGRLAVDLDKGITKGGLPPFLVVMPEAQDGSVLDDTEWANTPTGRYADAVLAVVHAVDRRFSTIPDRAARAIAGLSMGGYGAINITLRHLHVFGTVESWSGYYEQTPSGVFAGAPRARIAANSPVSFAPRLRARLQRLRLRVFLYTGSGDPLLRQQLAFAQELRGLGTDVRSGVLPGFHDWRLWRQQLPAALRYATRPWSGVGPGSVPG